MVTQQLVTAKVAIAMLLTSNALANLAIAAPAARLPSAVATIASVGRQKKIANANPVNVARVVAKRRHASAKIVNAEHLTKVVHVYHVSAVKVTSNLTPSQSRIYEN